MHNIAVNLHGPYYLCKAAVPHMIEREWGRIINFSGIAPYLGSYPGKSLVKLGIVGFTRGLAKQYGRYNITANCIAPGFIETDMTKDLPGGVIDHIKGVISTRDLGKPEDIAAAVAYVTSDDAGYLTGQTIAVDGGMTMC